MKEVEGTTEEAARRVGGMDGTRSGGEKRWRALHTNTQLRPGRETYNNHILQQTSRQKWEAPTWWRTAWTNACTNLETNGSDPVVNVKEIELDPDLFL